jgi:hypothetical protein
MAYGIIFSLLMQGDVLEVVAKVRRVWQQREEEVLRLVAEQLAMEISPSGFYGFEQQLQAVLRDAGREVLEVVVNALEPAEHPHWPSRVEQAGGVFRRRAQQTPHCNVATVFGLITLMRLGYRSCDEGEPSVFPLEQVLGLVQGCTPALAERVGFHAGQAGATQRTVLTLLRRDHGVTLGVGRLRKLLEALSQATEPLRRAAQARRVCGLLRQASARKGRGRPTLAVGRDGITVGNQPQGFFEVAACATLSVLDGRGKRLGTVSLGFAPELGQQTMTDELLALLHEILRQWTGSLPRLVYVSDAGDLEEMFYTRRLSRMRHPLAKTRLRWQRVVDYYHAAQRLTTLAESLCLEENLARAWARRMRRVLKEPNGVSRVLHSAGALWNRYGARNAAQTKAFATASSYLRRRTVWMRYHDFRSSGLPIGSGVTEAACKTLFTQRVKLSGMRWKRSGLQIVLNLRMLVLSGVWDGVYSRSLEERDALLIQTPTHPSRQTTRQAA